MDSETTTCEVLNHIVLKRISCKWWPLFAWCLRAERLGDCKTDRLTTSMFSGVPEVRGRPHLFSDTLPVSLSSQPTTEWIFGPVLGPEGGFGSEYGTHAAPLRYSDFAKSRFRRQMRAARWTTAECCDGKFPTTCTFEPNPTLLRPPFSSQCPTESTEDILPHPVLHIVTL